MPHRNKRILFITGDSLFRRQVRNSRFFTKHHLTHHFVETGAEAIAKLRDSVGTVYDFVVHAVGHNEDFIPLFLAIDAKIRPPLVIFELGGSAGHWDENIGFVANVDELESYIAIHLFHAVTENP